MVECVMVKTMTYSRKKVQMLTNSFHIQKHSEVDAKHQQYEYLAYLFVHYYIYIYKYHIGYFSFFQHITL